MRPLYIFDLDGTLALIGHRRHFVEDPKARSAQTGQLVKFKPRWDEFYEACDQDSVNVPVFKTLRILFAAGAEVRIFSGRSDAVREKTLTWLAREAPMIDWRREGMVTMRKNKDYTPDDALKLSWLMEMTEEDRARLVAVFDDRDRVVAMWRKFGITCFQVAPGEF